MGVVGLEWVAVQKGWKQLV